ncbi:CHAT domain-containing protein [Kitasatospora sp. NPDC057223]|uniref:CHAT domain-containing protein n=1 Tax=Kitasatospora sp. NPDC057223 TaxID=3346055 RepID=UPI00363B991A
MTRGKVREAEQLLGLKPVPRVPLRFRRTFTRAGHVLVDYTLWKPSAPRRLADLLDGVLSHPRFADCAPEFRVAVLTRAGLAHSWCAVGDNSAEATTTARSLLTEGLRLAPAASADEAWLHYALAHHLHGRYGRTHEPALLPAALDHARRAVAYTGEDRQLVALCRSRLAAVLLTQYREDGGTGVLAQALGHAEQAVAEGGDSPIGDRMGYNLAEALSARYDAYGSLDDLDRAIDLFERLRTSRTFRTLPVVGNPFPGTLGTLLRRKYLRTREPEVLDRAVRMLESVVGDGPAPDPVSMANLGNALLTRYENFGDREDLLRAVDLQLRVVDLRRSGSREQAVAHNNAGNALTAAWQDTGDDRLGRAALASYRTALDCTAEDAPERASRAYNLGSLLETMQTTAALDGRDSESAVSAADVAAAYRDAVRSGGDTCLEWALAAAHRWGRWAATRGSWTEAAEAYTDALDAAHQLFRVQLLREEKEAWLADVQGLPAEAAVALVRAGRTVEAVVALEAGRALLLSEALEPGRADLGRLAATGHRTEAEHYEAATRSLDAAMRVGAGPTVLRAHREAVDEAVARIRALDGHEGFLALPGFADVCRAVPVGAVLVYLASAESGGVALVVDGAGQATAVDLPAATRAAVERRARALLDNRPSTGGTTGVWRGALDAVTRWAWSALLAPALPATGEAEHLVLVPSGLIGMLPLHAAWRPDPGTPTGRYHLLDERAVSYTPNARALAVTARAAGRTFRSRLLVVADPGPGSRPTIGYARTETAWVRQWFAESRVLAGPDATADAVLTALAAADAEVHHVICHGRPDPGDPLRSALVMAGDRDLTLREVLAVRSSHGVPVGARMAVLSVCDTDRPGAALPDEAVSLPTGLIQAGFAGVVASQWAVRSEAASLVMARFYQLWQGEGLGPAQALRQAQLWLRDSTNREKIEDLSAAPVPDPADEDAAGLIRALRLRDLDERSYGRADVWAVFGFHGS